MAVRDKSHSARAFANAGIAMYYRSMDTQTLNSLEAIVSATPESAIKVEGGERFIPLPADQAIAKSELKGLKGLDFYEPDGEFFQLHKIEAVEGEIYENVDGRFLVLRVEATFKYGEAKAAVHEKFTIWIAEEDGGDIEAGDFEGPGANMYTGIESDLLEPLLRRFNL